MVGRKRERTRQERQDGFLAQKDTRMDADCIAWLDWEEAMGRFEASGLACAIDLAQSVSAHVGARVGAHQ